MRGFSMFAAAVAAAFLAGVPAAAHAGGCVHGGCQPASRTLVKTNYRVNTVYQPRVVTQYRDVAQVRNVTRYQDVVRPNYINVVHRTVDVTRVVPVTHVNVVTRVHPVTRVNTVTRVRNVDVYQHSQERVSQVVHGGGRTTYGQGTIIMPGRTTMGLGHTVHMYGGARSVWCGHCGR